MPLVVDAHSHLYPQSYVDLLRARESIPRISRHEGADYFVIFPEEEAAGPAGGRRFDSSYTSLDEKLKFMDRNGIDRSVVCLGNPWLDPLNGPDSPDIARKVNKELSEYEAATGGRVVCMGVLPSNDVADAAAAVRDVTRTSGLYGIVTGTLICGLTLDDARLDPLWATLEYHGVPVFVHPHYAAAVESLGGFGHALPVGVGFPFETTIAVARLVFAGVLYRYPGLKMLVAHGGGALPMLAGRMDAAWRSDPTTHGRLPEPPSTSVARLYGDLVLYHRRAMLAAQSVFGTERLVYGTDHPFSVSDPVVNISELNAAFDTATRDIVVSGANRLFGIS